MHQTINLYSFRDAFKYCGRGDNFSYNGLEALFDYLTEYEESTGESMDLDCIALCCDYSEHESALSCIEDHGYDFTPDGDDDEEREESALEYLRDNTIVIEFSGGIIIQGF